MTNMTENSEGYGLLSETSGVERMRDTRMQRHLPLDVGFKWLAMGWRDLVRQPLLSLLYGLSITVMSAVFVALLIAVKYDYILFPAAAGFLIVGPLLAVGLYAKSRALEAGKTVTLGEMVFVRLRSGAQIFFATLLLCLLTLLWMRAAVLLYALFFGVTSFPGLPHIVGLLLNEPMGWAMLAIGTAVGGFFASFAFALSAFSIPMLLDRPTDALTAMGTSMALVWNNIWPMIAWGAIVLFLCAVGLATFMLGFIVIFPLLGHASWHAYRLVADAEA